MITEEKALLAEALSDIAKLHGKIKAIDTHIDTFKSEIEEVSTRWSDDILEKSERILDRSIQDNRNAIYDTVKLTMADSTDRLIEKLNDVQINRSTVGKWLIGLIVANISMILVILGFVGYCFF